MYKRQPQRFSGAIAVLRAAIAADAAAVCGTRSRGEAEGSRTQVRHALALPAISGTAGALADRLAPTCEFVMRLSGAWRAKRAPLKGAIMDIEYPCGKDVVEAVLPHRDPFCWVSRVVAVSYTHLVRRGAFQGEGVLRRAGVGARAARGLLHGTCRVGHAARCTSTNVSRETFVRAYKCFT